MGGRGRVKEDLKDIKMWENRISENNIGLVSKIRNEKGKRRTKGWARKMKRGKGGGKMNVKIKRIRRRK